MNKIQTKIPINKTLVFLS